MQLFLLIFVRNNQRTLNKGNEYPTYNKKKED